MKILNLKIKSPTNEIVRDIYFAENGISFIYGDIKEPQNKGATINSLGKSLLIKMIDYIFGANEDSTIMKAEIQSYFLEATIKVEGKRHIVLRKIGSSSDISVDGVKKSLTEYKDFFSIERRLYDKQLLTRKKASELSQNNQRPVKNDYTDFLKMLEIDSLVELVSNIYDSQDSIKTMKDNKKQLVAFYGDITLKQIDEEIYFVDKEIHKLTKELQDLSKKIKMIGISDIQQNIIEEYSVYSDRLKRIKRTIENEKLERKRLIDFIESSKKTDIKAEHLLTLFEKAKQELPEMVKKTLEEVEAFHDKVYEERKDFLTLKIQGLDKNISVLEDELSAISTELDRLGAIISANQVYQESIVIYEKYNTDLQNLKFREGKLSQIKSLDSEIKKEDDNLTRDFNTAKEVLQQYGNLVNEYREYINELTKKIYSSEISTYFNIEIIKKHIQNRPVKVEITMRGDTGEGIGEVKKSLIDYLLFEFNKFIEILIQDSSCFNGIDPRQINNMLLAVSEIAVKIDKQAIIAINKYQLADYDNAINYIAENSAIILSESDKLMKFDF